MKDVRSSMCSCIPNKGSFLGKLKRCSRGTTNFKRSLAFVVAFFIAFTTVFAGVPAGLVKADNSFNPIWSDDTSSTAKCNWTTSNTYNSYKVRVAVFLNQDDTEELDSFETVSSVSGVDVSATLVELGDEINVGGRDEHAIGYSRFNDDGTIPEYQKVENLYVSFQVVGSTDNGESYEGFESAQVSEKKAYRVTNKNKIETPTSAPVASYDAEEGRLELTLNSMYNAPEDALNRRIMIKILPRYDNGQLVFTGRDALFDSIELSHNPKPEGADETVTYNMTEALDIAMYYYVTQSPYNPDGDYDVCFCEFVYASDDSATLINSDRSPYSNVVTVHCEKKEQYNNTHTKIDEDLNVTWTPDNRATIDQYIINLTIRDPRQDELNQDYGQMVVTKDLVKGNADDLAKWNALDVTAQTCTLNVSDYIRRHLSFVEDDIENITVWVNVSCQPKDSKDPIAPSPFSSDETHTPYAVTDLYEIDDTPKNMTITANDEGYLLTWKQRSTDYDEDLQVSFICNGKEYKTYSGGKIPAYPRSPFTQGSENCSYEGHMYTYEKQITFEELEREYNNAGFRGETVIPVFRHHLAKGFCGIEGLSAPAECRIMGGYSGEGYTEIESYDVTPINDAFIRKDASYKLGIANVEPQKATHGKEEWESKDTSVVTVDSKGRITGVETGSADVYCTINSIENKKTTVHVYELDETVAGVDDSEQAKAVLDETQEIIDSIGNDEVPDLSNIDLSTGFANADGAKTEIINAITEGDTFGTELKGVAETEGSYETLYAEEWNKDITTNSEHSGWSFWQWFWWWLFGGYTGNHSYVFSCGYDYTMSLYHKPKTGGAAPTEIGTIKEFDSPIDMSITLNDKTQVDSGKERRYKVVRIHDGKPEIMDSSEWYIGNDGKIHVKSKKFSEFLTMYEDVETGADDKTPLSTAQVTVSGVYNYTGNEIVPEAKDVCVKVGDTVISSENYTFEVENNIEVGTATLTVTAKQDSAYEGSATGTFTIENEVISGIAWADDQVATANWIPEEKYQSYKVRVWCYVNSDDEQAIYSDSYDDLIADGPGIDLSYEIRNRCSYYKGGALSKVYARFAVYGSMDGQTYLENSAKSALWEMSLSSKQQWKTPSTPTVEVRDNKVYFIQGNDVCNDQYGALIGVKVIDSTDPETGKPYEGYLENKYINKYSFLDEATGEYTKEYCTEDITDALNGFLRYRGLTDREYAIKFYSKVRVDSTDDYYIDSNPSDLSNAISFQGMADTRPIVKFATPDNFTVNDENDELTVSWTKVDGAVIDNYRIACIVYDTEGTLLDGFELSREFASRYGEESTEYLAWSEPVSSDTYSVNIKPVLNKEICRQCNLKSDRVKIELFVYVDPTDEQYCSDQYIYRPSENSPTITKTIDVQRVYLFETPSDISLEKQEDGFHISWKQNASTIAEINKNEQNLFNYAFGIRIGFDYLDKHYEGNNLTGFRRYECTELSVTDTEDENVKLVSLVIPFETINTEYERVPISNGFDDYVGFRGEAVDVTIEISIGNLAFHYSDVGVYNGDPVKFSGYDSNTGTERKQVTDYEISPSEIILRKYSNIKPSVRILSEAGATYNVRFWETSNENVTSVEFDHIYGDEVGDAEITCIINSLRRSVPVHVYEVNPTGVNEGDEQTVIETTGDIIDSIGNNNGAEAALNNVELDESVKDKNLEQLKNELVTAVKNDDVIGTEMAGDKKDMEYYENLYANYYAGSPMDFWTWFWWWVLGDAATGHNYSFGCGYDFYLQMYHTDNMGNGTRHNIGKIRELNSEIGMSFNPGNMGTPGYGKERTYKLIRIHDTGKTGANKFEIEEIPFTYEHGEFAAQSDKFSDFIVVYEDVQSSTPVHSHYYTGTVTKEASCTETGVRTYRCSCGSSYTETIPKAAHTLIAHEAKEATCGEDGNKTYWECSVCEKLFSDAQGNMETTAEAVKIGKATGKHTLVAHEAEEATCEKEGKKAYWECSVCKKLFEDKDGKTETTEDKLKEEKKPHTLTAHEAVEATCTEDGNKAYWECSVCKKLFLDKDGKTEITEEALVEKAKGHKLTAHAEVKATCTEDGKKAYWECSECKKLFADAEGKTETTEAELVVKTEGHKLTHVEAVEATPEKDGNIEYWTCSECGKYFADAEGKSEITKEQTVLPKSEHKLTLVPEKKATCTEDGNKAYYTCSHCDKLFEDAEGKKEISKEETIIKSEGHKLTHVEAKDPTVEEDGNIEYWTCTECGKFFKDAEGKEEITEEETKVEKLINIAEAVVTGLGNKAWTGSAIKPTVTVKYDGKTLKKGTDYTVSYSNNTNAGNATVKITGKGKYGGTVKKTFAIKKVTLKYRAYVQKKNWMSWSTAGIGTKVNEAKFAGTTDNLRMETIQMQLTGIGGSVKYRAYVEKMGWTQWATTADKSTYAGTKGMSRRVEMIQLKAAGQVANLYDMYYRTYCEKFGWLGWAGNNEKSGSAGYARKLEAFQVQFVPKGTKFDQGTAKAFYDMARDGMQ